MAMSLSNPEPRPQTCGAVVADAFENREERLCYLALDVPHRGQASFIHINEMVENLRRRGWSLDLYMPTPASGSRRPTMIARLVNQARVMLRIMTKLRNYDAIYIRAHFLAWPVTRAAR